MNVGTDTFDWNQLQLIVAGIATGAIGVYAVYKVMKMYFSNKAEQATGYVGQEEKAKSYGSLIGEAAIATVAVWAVIYILPKVAGWLISGLSSAA